MSLCGRFEDFSSSHPVEPKTVFDTLRTKLSTYVIVNKDQKFHLEDLEKLFLLEFEDNWRGRCQIKFNSAHPHAVLFETTTLHLSFWSERGEEQDAQPRYSSGLLNRTKNKDLATIIFVDKETRQRIPKPSDEDFAVSEVQGQALSQGVVSCQPRCLKPQETCEDEFTAAISTIMQFGGEEGMAYYRQKLRRLEAYRSIDAVADQPEQKLDWNAAESDEDSKSTSRDADDPDRTLTPRACRGFQSPDSTLLHTPARKTESRRRSQTDQPNCSRMLKDNMKEDRDTSSKDDDDDNDVWHPPPLKRNCNSYTPPEFRLKKMRMRRGLGSESPESE